MFKSVWYQRFTILLYWITRFVDGIDFNFYQWFAKKKSLFYILIDFTEAVRSVWQQHYHWSHQRLSCWQLHCSHQWEGCHCEDLPASVLTPHYGGDFYLEVRGLLRQLCEHAVIDQNYATINVMLAVLTKAYDVTIWWLYRSTLVEYYQQLVLPTGH